MFISEVIHLHHRPESENSDKEKDEEKRCPLQISEDAYFLRHIYIFKCTHMYLSNIKTYFDFSMLFLFHKIVNIAPCQYALYTFSIATWCSIILISDN